MVNPRWHDLSRLEKLQLLGFALVLPLISASLKVIGYRRTRGIIDGTWHGRTPPSPATPETIARLDRMAWIARKAATYTPANTSCLRQALLVHAIALREGLAPELRFGVGHVQGAVDMHAWVELDGHPLAQPDLRHKPFQ